jgi:hypothetical protein
VDGAGAGHEHSCTVPAVQRNGVRGGLHAWQSSSPRLRAHTRVFSRMDETT